MLRLEPGTCRFGRFYGVRSKSPKLKSLKSKFPMSKFPKLLNNVIDLRS